MHYIKRVTGFCLILVSCTDKMAESNVITEGQMVTETGNLTEVSELTGEERAEYEKLKALYNGKSLNECFALMHLSCSRDVKSVRAELTAVTKRVDDLENYATNVEQSLRELNETTIVNIEQSVTDESHEREKLKHWGRKWNLVVKGVSGNLKERPRDTEKKVKQFMIDTLKLDAEFSNGCLFQAVHRLPSGDTEKRSIIVLFVSLMDRDDVLTAARKLEKGSGYSVVPDLVPSANQLRIKLLGELRAMEPDVRKKHRLVYLKEPPFVALKAI